MVTETKLKKLKIDVVNELHEIRRKHAWVSSAQIERAAAEVLEELRKREK